MKVYKSKIGYGLVLFIAIVLGVSSYPIIKEGLWKGLWPIVLTILFFVYVFRNTRYIINGDTLQVQCGVFMNKSYAINQIAKIRETNNPISAPATSMDRLEVSMHNGKSVIISPKKKQAFIDHLKRLNPQIRVTLK